MSNKKHIDRVFQEKLKDFEVSPNPKVWQNIKAELEQSEDKKKVFPIWWRFAGVAALIFILFTIGNSIISNSDNSSNTKIVDTENTSNSSDNQSGSINTNNSTEKGQNTTENDGITDVHSPDFNSEISNQATYNSSVINNNRDSMNTGLADSKSLVDTNSTNEAVIRNRSKDNNSIDKKRTNTNNLTQSNNKNIANRLINRIAQNDNPINSTSDKTNENSSDKNINRSDVSYSPTKSQDIAQNTTESENKDPSTIANLNKENIDTALKNNPDNSLVENQLNSEEQDKNIDENDTTTDEETEKDSPTIEEEIAIAEDLIEKEEEKVDRWQVYANVAPVYYNTLGQGSHIDEQFVENSKSGEVNTSYGVNVSYVLSKKFKLKAGFNSLNLSYDTDNVILYENVGINASDSPRNLDLNDTGQSISAISNSNLGAQQLTDFFGENANAAISQRLSYYEVPLEVEYNLVDNKFGVNVIGGFSTFILNDNKVYSEFDGYKTEVGEANNINDVSFSGNIGLGLDYKFTDKIKFNMQPTFKYQLNAYKNTSGNFRPYIVGVYTGLSYKF